MPQALIGPMGPLGGRKWVHLLMWELHQPMRDSLETKQFLFHQAAILAPALKLFSVEPSPLITMRPTLALRAFRPTARMMRPVPVSAGHS